VCLSISVPVNQNSSSSSPKAPLTMWKLPRLPPPLSSSAVRPYAWRTSLLIYISGDRKGRERRAGGGMNVEMISYAARSCCHCCCFCCTPRRATNCRKRAAPTAPNPQRHTAPEEPELLLVADPRLRPLRQRGQLRLHLARPVLDRAGDGVGVLVEVAAGRGGVSVGCRWGERGEPQETGLARVD